MRNDYGGTCYKCGLWVEPGTGHFNRHKSKWRVHHALPENKSKTAVSCDAAKKRDEVLKRKGVFDEL